MRGIVAVAVGTFGLLDMTGVAKAQNLSQCLVRLGVEAPNATTSRDGRLIQATADASGWCTYTLTVCVNDVRGAGCTGGQISKIKIAGGGGRDLSGLQQSLQAQLPADQKVCANSIVRVGQTRHATLRAGAVTTDRRAGTDYVTLVCQCAADVQRFNSTFDAIQKVIFDNHGCSQDVCHGRAKQSSLQLTAGVAYQNIVDVASAESDLKRVAPGEKDRSFLWLKLAANTDPSLLPMGAQVAGAPMPLGLTAISADQLEALRRWIVGGAPQTGTVAGTETLLDACMPPAEPVRIKPLAPPQPGQGVQFVMPPWKLEAHSEHEICFATYYDITDQVPTDFQDPSGTLFRFSGQELRQDPQSHHLILNRYAGAADMIHDPSFDTWTCNGGERNGQTCGGPTDVSCRSGTCTRTATWACNGGEKDGRTCEPTDLTSCGAGTCVSPIKQSFACNGFGPPLGTTPQPTPGPGCTTDVVPFGARQPFYGIGGAQTAQYTIDYPQGTPGAFAQIPMKGILYWNSHAFNLTDEDTVMHARLNYTFARAQRSPVHPIFDTSKIFAANAAPYTTETVCNDYTLPQGARLINLTSHTHKHGKHFTVTAPDGALIYESFIYNDPANVNFDPALHFDSPDPVQRTLHYCSLYNNGVAEDGSPDPTTVTRRSQTPQSAQDTLGLCSPTACWSDKAGYPRIGARCRGVDDDQACASTPGTNDGSCDACALTFGESTENEMFILIGTYYVDPDFAEPGGSGCELGALSADVTGRSLSTQVVVPAQMGCSASHGMHALHTARHSH